MEDNIRMCSSENHKDIKAVIFCPQCRIYMCNKCEKYHLELFKNHSPLKLDNNKDINNIFTGLCDEKNHLYNLLRKFITQFRAIDSRDKKYF